MITIDVQIESSKPTAYIFCRGEYKSAWAGPDDTIWLKRRAKVIAPVKLGMMMMMIIYEAHSICWAVSHPKSRKIRRKIS